MALDAHSRACSYPQFNSLISLVPTYDFSAAFASVLHSYLEWMLVRMGCPPDKLKLLLSFYWYCMSYISSDRGLVTFLLYLSGIIQVCPLSGSMFALAIDPILRYMRHSPEAACREYADGATFVLRACADDIGASLSRMSLLRALYQPFQVAEFAAGLKLKTEGVQACCFCPTFFVCKDEDQGEFAPLG